MADNPIDLTLDSDTEVEEDGEIDEDLDPVTIDLCDSDVEFKNDESRADSPNLPPQGVSGAAERFVEVPAQAASRSISVVEEPSGNLHAGGDDASAAFAPPGTVPPTSSFAAPAGLRGGPAKSGDCTAPKAVTRRESDTPRNTDAEVCSH